jgi:hypothetical protein
VRFVYTLGAPKLRAWDLPGKMDPRTVDTREYRKLLLRAAESILTPFKIDPNPQEGIPLMLSEPRKAFANVEEGNLVQA